MPAKISGYIFNDLNHNGTFNTSEPGISNCYISLSTPSNTCISGITNSSGYYEFLNITLPGSYTIYETVTTPNLCPPTLFSQPIGLNGSTTRRKLTLTLTQAQINSNTSFNNNNFGHDYTVIFGCTPFAWQYAGGNLVRIDLALGTYINLGAGTPSSSNLNGAGYNATDGNMYGWNGTSIFRGSKDKILLTLPLVLNLPTANYNCGDVTADGYLYIYSGNTTTLYTVDVNPNRSTYGLLVNPQNNFSERTSAPFGITMTALSISDFAINPLDGFIYAMDSTGAAKKN